MKAFVLYNPRSGGGKGDGSDVRDRLAAAFVAAGVDADLVALDESVDLATVINAARGKGIDVIVAPGGDGTVNAIASLLAGTDTPLGVIPAGTLNHFSKDAG